MPVLNAAITEIDDHQRDAHPLCPRVVLALGMDVVQVLRARAHDGGRRLAGDVGELTILAAGDEHSVVERRGGVRECQIARQDDVAEPVRPPVDRDHAQLRRRAVGQTRVEDASGRHAAGVGERVADGDAVASHRGERACADVEIERAAGRSGVEAGGLPAVAFMGELAVLTGEREDRNPSRDPALELADLRGLRDHHRPYLGAPGIE
jgi:hypothetical protein